MTDHPELNLPQELIDDVASNQKISKHFGDSARQEAIQINDTIWGRPIVLTDDLLKADRVNLESWSQYRGRKREASKLAEIKPNLTPRRMAIKSVLDKWSAGTISVDDAENEMVKLFASVVGECDIEAGNIKIRTQPHGLSYNGVFEIDWHAMPDFCKLTLTFEMAKRTRMVLECPVVGNP